MTATYHVGDVTEALCAFEQIKAIALGLAPKISPAKAGKPQK